MEQRGFERTMVVDIAARAGVSQTFYRPFPCTDEQRIADRLVADGVPVLTARVEWAPISRWRMV